MNLLNILLQATTAQSGGPSMWIMLLLMIVIFYFFMIRPQSKKAKEERKFRDSLQKGDKVVTAGGIHGRETLRKLAVNSMKRWLKQLPMRPRVRL